MALAPKKKKKAVAKTAPPPVGMPSAGSGAVNPGKAMVQELAQIMGLNRLRSMRGRQGMTQP